MKKYVIFLFLILILIYPINVLKIKFNEKLIFCTLTFSSNNVELDYTHSVSLTKVVDIYIVNESGIYAYETKWQDFEAGQPLDGYFKNGFLIKKINMYLGKKWSYWFIPLNNATVKVNGKAVFSNNKREGLLSFEISKSSIGALILGWCL